MAGLLDLVPGVGQIASPILNALGTQSAGQQQRAGLNAAMGQLQTGYGNAKGVQQPIYDTATGAYKNLVGKTDAGDFSTPTMSPFQMPTNWQADPGYQFSLDQGLKQINGQQAAGGMGNSGATAKALEGFGINTANQEYGDIYNRLKGASDTAFNQNLIGKNQNFNQLQTLTNPMMSSANNLMNLDTGLGTGLAGIEEQKGGINAALAANPYSAAGGTLGAATQQGGIPGQNGQQMSPGMIQQLLGLLGPQDVSGLY